MIKRLDSFMVFRDDPQDAVWPMDALLVFAEVTSPVRSAERQGAMSLDLWEPGAPIRGQDHKGGKGVARQ